jgi:hypothetical protein
LPTLRSRRKQVLFLPPVGVTFSSTLCLLLPESITDHIHVYRLTDLDFELYKLSVNASLQCLTVQTINEMENSSCNFLPQVYCELLEVEWTGMIAI